MGALIILAVGGAIIYAEITATRLAYETGHQPSAVEVGKHVVSKLTAPDLAPFLYGALFGEIEVILWANGMQPLALALLLWAGIGHATR